MVSAAINNSHLFIIFYIEIDELSFAVEYDLHYAEIAELNSIMERGVKICVHQVGRSIVSKKEFDNIVMLL
jgi:DNA-binding sugar fermentation-stimulating protein